MTCIQTTESRLRAPARAGHVVSIRDERASGLTGFVRGTFPPSFPPFGGKPNEGRQDMIVLGLILLIIGLVASIPILTTIGAILLIVGLVLNLVPIGGTRRRVY